jgi:uncharacterized membrane protein
MKKTRFANYKKAAFVFLVLLFILTSIFPCFYFTDERIQSSVSDEEIQAFIWLRENTNKRSTILGSLSQGHLITAIAERKNVIDSDFLLIHLPENRIDDVKTIYTTRYKTIAVDLLNEYDVDYILFSPKIAEELDIDQINYIDDEKCFELVYDEDVQIYRSLCRIEKL